MDFWITAHRDLADAAFSEPMRGRLESIRDRLATHGYSLKLDIGKRSTRATVASPSLRAKSTYKSVEGFMRTEEARLDEMDERKRVKTPTPSPDTTGANRG